MLMLSILKLVSLLGLMSVLIFIVIQNVQARVDVHLEPFALYERQPLALVMFCSYLAGLITFAVIHVFHVVRMKTQIARLRRENRRVGEELHQLRSITLEELPLEEDPALGPPKS
ncbi:MAG: hypothetical protein R3E12_05795 [Candidatus Eisenbacteria bacterium]|uniref:LapA family protein n=1 Tax=Eiseniibacteriota bacterium TaxID=2212470 RepID=A0A956RRM5_UNCEI|nr:hypothetical protein [Candidatus Eisenbacteria bacterium]